MKAIILLSISILVLTGSNCQRQVYSGSLYLAGYRNDWGPSENCLRFIEYQVIPKLYMQHVPYGTELVIEKNKITDIYEYSYGRRSSPESFTPFSLQTSQLNPERNIPYSIRKAATSKSYLGGEKPRDFKIPYYNDEIAFQYFGMLAADESPNNILDFDLHLTAPLYDSFTELYLDYSNPNEPKILRGEESHFDRSFDEMDATSEVVFEKTPIQFVKGGGGSIFHFGNTGFPSWIQGPFYPVCPVTGEKMIFLASFNTTNSKEQIAVKSKNFAVEEQSERHFQELDFWITGAIYIFINPKARTVCYFLQTT
jgi:hypothetical protein